MGHTEGKGLGRNQQGRANIVEASKQRGRRGLGLTVQGFEEQSDIGWNFEKDTVRLYFISPVRCSKNIGEI